MLARRAREENDKVLILWVTAVLSFIRIRQTLQCFCSSMHMTGDDRYASSSQRQ